MRRIMMAVALAAGLAGSVSAVQAMPMAPVQSLSVEPQITLVSGGCGPYRHRGPYGGCRPNFGGPRFYGRPRFFGPGRFHRGPHFFHRRFR